MQMGLNASVAGSEVVFKRKFRWIFRIPTITDDGVFALPPVRGSRPTISLKETNVQHLNEEIFFPVKADWKPITLTLYDIAKSTHPIIEWLSMVYNINSDDTHEWYPSVPGQDTAVNVPFKQTAYLELYDGCGTIIEKWKYENCWPQSVEFSDLDMASSEILLVNITLRYDRANWMKGCG